MKAVLVIDVPTLNDGRHLCDECPIWNNEHFFCQYGFNTKAKGCPLKPMPTIRNDDTEEKGFHIGMFNYGWNECLKEIEK